MLKSTARLTHVLIAAATAALLSACGSQEVKPEAQAVSPTQGSAPTQAPAPAPAPVEAKSRAAVAAPAPAPAPAAPKKVSFTGTGYFDFDKAVLRSDTKSALDKEVMARKGEVTTLNTVLVDGHADRLGSHEYNQRLSEKRAEVVKAYLVEKGMPANNIVTNGYGKTQPATGANVAKCPDTLKKPELIKCLQPHRRAVVTVSGTAQ